MKILTGDALKTLKTLPVQSVHCCVTSPPYWNLRDYGVEGQLGLEKTPQEYVQKLVAVFSQVRRVLRSDGTLWLNLGDSYARNPKRGIKFEGGNQAIQDRQTIERNRGPEVPSGTKEKDMIGIPWRVAFALQGDGWYLRQDIIWHKPNPIPESVTDRCTKSHEFIFLLSKSAEYFFDNDAIKEPAAYPKDDRGARKDSRRGAECNSMSGKNGLTRNKRDVWTITTKPYKDAHFATFPPEIPETCIKAGCPEGGTVLDPFHGAGTTWMVAERLNKDYIGIDINPEYIELSKNRVFKDSPLFNRKVLDIAG